MRKMHRVLGLVLLLAGVPAGADQICSPEDAGALRACLEDRGDPVKLLAPGTYPPLGTIAAFDGLRIGALDASDPPVIACALGTDGRPLTAASNVGLGLQAVGAGVKGVEVDGLVFESCARGVFSLGVAAPGTTAPLGWFDGLAIRGVTVTNAYIGLDLNALHAASAYDNRVYDGDVGIAVVGSRPLADDPGAGLTLTQTVTVSHNLIRGNDDPAWPLKTQHIGIFVNNLNGAIYANNIRAYKRYSGPAGRGISVSARDTPGEFNLHIYDNLIRSVTGGITTGGPSDPVTKAHLTRARGSIEGNNIQEYDNWGITAFHGSSGWTIGPNNIKNGPQADPPLPEGWGGDILLMGPVLIPDPRLPPPPVVSGSSYTTVFITPKQVVINKGSDTNTVTVIDH